MSSLADALTDCATPACEPEWSTVRATAAFFAAHSVRVAADSKPNARVTDLLAQFLGEKEPLLRGWAAKSFGVIHGLE